MKPDSTPYTPVSCALYDELELAAIRQRSLKISFKDQKGDLGHYQGLIRDVHCARDRVEYVILQDGRRLRLDAIQALDDQPFRPPC